MYNHHTKINSLKWLFVRFFYRHIDNRLFQVIIMNNNSETSMYILAVLFGILFFVLFMVVIVKEFTIFKAKRDYILMEMKRASGQGISYWKSELKKLYISYIPFIT